MFARKNGVVDSILDGVGMGLGFLLALLVMAFIREVFGAGAFFGIELPFMAQVKIPALTQAPGGFLVFGIVIAVMNKLKSIEQLKEKRLQQYMAEALQEEQKQLDEIGGQLYFRNQG